MPGPLSGIRVVDLTAMASGPFATAILGDQGAEVVKVEPPGTGDLLRHIGTTRGGISAVFANINRNKRSIVIDLRCAAGVATLQRLVAHADVFVQNFRPGVIERMGLGEAALCEENPGLVYVSISGFGAQGPDAQRKVYDSVMQAYAGFAAHQSNPATGVPEFVRNVVCDKSTALTTAQAITAALFARERNGGTGQAVRVSMLHACLAFLWPDGMQNHTFIDDAAAGGDPAAAMGRATLPAIRATSDGFVAITTIADGEFRGLCRALDRPELVEDARFQQAGARARNADALQATLAPLIAARSTRALLARLEAEEVPHAPVTMLDELPRHPQVVANDLLFVAEHPTAGTMRGPRPVAEFANTPCDVHRLAPSLGEHTDELLTEAGLSPGEIAALREQGAVA